MPRFPNPPMNDIASSEVERELAKLRKAVLRQGHHLDLVRERTDEGLRRIEERLGNGTGRTEPSSGQVRALMELGRAVQSLVGLADGSTADEAQDDEERPRSLREGLDLLEIRIANLQRSFDLRPIRSVGLAFDDRLHEARGVRFDPAQPEGVVLEELLPGFTLGGRVVRPALVVVNRPNST